MKLSIAHFSRQQEFEADKIGIGNIAKAGYDPYAASRFLTSLGRWSALRASLIGLARRRQARHDGDPSFHAGAHRRRRSRRRGSSARRASARPRATPISRAIDGIAFGDDPDAGARARRRGSCIPSSASRSRRREGFALENQSAALIGVGEGGAQALRLDSIELSDSTTLESALGSGWIDGVKTSSIETINGGDMPMATAVAQGEQWSFRLGAVRLGGRRLSPDLRRAQLTPAVDARFRAAIRLSIA